VEGATEASGVNNLDSPTSSQPDVVFQCLLFRLSHPLESFLADPNPLSDLMIVNRAAFPKFSETECIAA
jgi:hypothetical protein